MTVSKGTILTQGALAGLIGYVTLAALVSLMDMSNGESAFRTAAVLGAAMFYGVTDPSQVQILPDYVLAYNGAHLLAFLAFGVIAAALAALADRGSQLWYLSAFFYIFIAFHSIGFVQAMSEETRSALPSTTIWIGGVVAAIAMGLYLVRAHPKMRRAQSWSD